MNDNIQSDRDSRASWPNGGTDLPLPGRSILLESGDALPPAADMLDGPVQSAYDGIDRMADVAAPTVRQLAEGAAAAEVALRVKATQLRESSDQWVDSARAKVRGSPLVAIVAAVALGAMVGRLARSAR
jgi:hypothetical protein